MIPESDGSFQIARNRVSAAVICFGLFLAGFTFEKFKRNTMWHRSRHCLRHLPTPVAVQLACSRVHSGRATLTLNLESAFPTSDVSFFRPRLRSTKGHAFTFLPSGFAFATTFLAPTHVLRTRTHCTCFWLDRHIWHAHAACSFACSRPAAASFSHAASAIAAAASVSRCFPVSAAYSFSCCRPAAASFSPAASAIAAAATVSRCFLVFATSGPFWLVQFLNSSSCSILFLEYFLGFASSGFFLVRHENAASSFSCSHAVALWFATSAAASFSHAASAIAAAASVSRCFPVSAAYSFS
jgi:hypothetical protein